MASKNVNNTLKNPQPALFTVSYKVPTKIIDGISVAEEYIQRCRMNAIVIHRTNIEVTRFNSLISNAEKIQNIVRDVSESFLPLPFPLEFGFDPDTLSVSNPCVSLGIPDKAGLRLLALEQAILDGVKPCVHIPEIMPTNIHPKQQGYFKQYGQTDVLRWQKDRFTVIRFSGYHVAKELVHELSNKFKPVEERVVITELLIDAERN